MNDLGTGLRALGMAAAGLTLALALDAAPAWAATQRMSVRVDVRGLTGDLRRNAVSILTIRKHEKDLSEGRLRSLHEQAQNEIRRALQPFGYYQPVIQSELTANGNRWHAVYTVDPGPVIHLTAVSVGVEGDGAADPRFQRLIQTFPLHAGDVPRHATYELGKSRFVALAARAGYLDADFDTSEILVDLATYSSRIDLHFVTGPRYEFGPVTFHQDVMSPDFLQSYVTFQRGTPLDAGNLLKLQVALAESPYFSRVEVEPRRDQAQGLEVPIDVGLVPAKPRRFTFGIGYGTDDGPHGKIGTEFRRLNRRGHRAEINASVAKIDKGASVQYLIPWSYPRTDLLTLSTGYHELHPANIVSKTSRVAAGLSRTLGSWETSASLTYQRERFSVGPDSGMVGLLLPEVSWLQLQADNRVHPRSGHRLRVMLRGADPQVASDVSLLQGLVQAKSIATLAGRNRFIVRGEAGGIRTSQFRRLPASMRFFAGGAQSIRGFGYNTLGARAENGQVIGGRYLLVGSAEYEFWLTKKWGMAVFYDAGNAMMSWSDHIAQGTGLGLRWMSPVGPVRADAGFGVSEPGTPFQIHFTIGPEL